MVRDEVGYAITKESTIKERSELRYDVRFSPNVGGITLGPNRFSK
jgi:hypothetical protein